MLAVSKMARPCNTLNHEFSISDSTVFKWNRMYGPHIIIVSYSSEGGVKYAIRWFPVVPDYLSASWLDRHLITHRKYVNRTSWQCLHYLQRGYNESRFSLV
jgi:hypothetical protein